MRTNTEMRIVSKAMHHALNYTGEEMETAIKGFDDTGYLNALLQIKTTDNGYTYRGIEITDEEYTKILFHQVIEFRLWNLVNTKEILSLLD